MRARSKLVAESASSSFSLSTGSHSGPAVAARSVDRLAAEIDELTGLDLTRLRLRWRNHLGGTVPAHLPKWLLVRILAYRIQASVHGGLDGDTMRRIRGSSAGAIADSPTHFAHRSPATKEGVSLRPGALLVREWQGQLHTVMILEEGFAWNGETYSSLSKVASAITGVNWNGHRFFGLRKAPANPASATDAQ